MKKRKMYRNFLIVLGTIFISFGCQAFLTPLNINSGGLNGIGIFTTFFIKDANLKTIMYNVIVTGAEVLLWVVGLFFLGKTTARKTLLSTICFPLANALFTLVPGTSDAIKWIAKLVANEGNITPGTLILGSLFGGVFVGFGVAIAFAGGGSSGGVDIITLILDKYAHIKSSIASFIIDGSIIAIGMAITVPFDNSVFIPSLCGIVSAFITAIVIDYVFVAGNSGYQADIISDKWEEISRYAQDKLGRGATIIPAKGGYKGEERVVLRVVIDKNQYNRLKEKIHRIDPHAFITFTTSKSVFGEGFVLPQDEKDKFKLFKKKNSSHEVDQ